MISNQHTETIPTGSIQKAGFGLAELLVAIALFITGFVILLGVLTSSTHAVKHGQDRMYAIQMAERIVELWRSKTYSTVTLGTTSDTVNYSYRSTGQNITLTYSYDVDVTMVTPTPTPPDQPLKQVRITVRYPVDSDTNGTVVLETAVADLTAVVAGTTTGGTGGTAVTTGGTAVTTGTATATVTTGATVGLTNGNGNGGNGNGNGGNGNGNGGNGNGNGGNGNGNGNGGN